MEFWSCKFNAILNNGCGVEFPVVEVSAWEFSESLVMREEMVANCLSYVAWVLINDVV